VTGDHQEPTREPHDLRHLAEIRTALLHAGAGRAKARHRPLEDGPHFVVDRHQAIEVGRPRDAPALHRRRPHRPRRESKALVDPRPETTAEALSLLEEVTLLLSSSGVTAASVLVSDPSTVIAEMTSQESYEDDPIAGGGGRL